jgi:tRNA pseudouridine38-40 synthase
MSLRRLDGFRRYALAVQYHGASFLGFSYHGDHNEDRILPDGADLRGYRSVEGRVREALNNLFEDRWENFQVSSRTDRGVHALKNTFHVDIRGDSESTILQKLGRGLNHQIARQNTSWSQNQEYNTRKQRRNSKSNFTVFEEDDWRRHSVSDELRILAAKPAPDYMYNPFSERDPSQPTEVDWNARFSATQRTYIYRILTFNGDDGDWGVPFEWDRSWRLRRLLNVEDMQQAANLLEGTHDFSSFRGADCQRQSPVVHMESVGVRAFPYGPSNAGGMAGGGGLLSFGEGDPDSFPQLITISIVGNAFLYRQVRNMVGCLVEVGRGRLPPNKVEDLLCAKDRRIAPAMAPAHGLFLVDVQHGDFYI